MNDFLTINETLATPSSVSMIFFFGSITFATIGMATRTWLLGDSRAIQEALSVSSSANSSKGMVAATIRPLEQTYISLYTLLHHLSLLGLVMLVLYVVEHRPPMPDVERLDFDEDLFWFLGILILALALKTVRRNVHKNKNGNGHNSTDVANSDTMVNNNNGGDMATHNPNNSALAKQKRRNSNESTTITSAEEIDFHNPNSSSSFKSTRRGSIHSDDLLSMLDGKDQQVLAGGTSKNANTISNHGNNNSTKTITNASTENKHKISSHSKTNNTVGEENAKILEEILLDTTTNNGSDKEILDHHSASSSNISSTENGQYCMTVDGKLILKPILPNEDLLNPYQTMEWKGLMSICLLLYQYTNAGSHGVYVETDPTDTSYDQTIYSSTNIYYNLARVGATSYLFLTGYGHFMKMYRCNDYTISRLLKVAFRMNTGAVFICMTLGRSYLFYHACAIHTYFFFMVYLTLKWGSWNDTGSLLSSTNVANYNKYTLRFKILCAAFIIFFLWDIDIGFFWTLHALFFGSSHAGIPGAPYGKLWEFYFRTHLHHWSALLGMIFALNHPVASFLTRKLEARSFIRNSHIFGSTWSLLSTKGIVGFALLAVTSIWAYGPLQSSKFAYNSTNPYFGFLPLLCYIYWRNISTSLRETHIGLFRNIGTLSLEIYLLHHHFFLSGGTDSHNTEIARNKFTLIHGYPYCNLLSVICLLLFISKVMHTLTYVVNSMLLPHHNDVVCMRNALVFISIIGFFFITSYTLDAMDLISSGTIFTGTIVCGMLLYQTIMDMTWVEYRTSRLAPFAKNNDDEHRAKQAMDDSVVAKVSPPLVGTMVILLLGVLCHISSHSGNAPLSFQLPSACGEVANDGKWFPIDSCSDIHGGLAKRMYGIGTILKSCPAKQKDVKSNSNTTTPMSVKMSSTLWQWGWNDNIYGSNCRFRHRHQIELQKKLLHRKIVFIGDTSTRNLFHATCRALGDPDAGNYDATVPIHSDITKTVSDTSLEYKWAPLAIDQVAKLKEYNVMRKSMDQGEESGKSGSTIVSASENAGHLPDILLVGGGAWDRLHVWATDEDRESHKSAIGRLASEMTSLSSTTSTTSSSIPTVWFVPTTINTRGLNNEEKRTQMGEEAVDEMRHLYFDLGVIDAASFVLDGQSFTRSRAEESYDGLHYAMEIYDVGAQILGNALDWLIPGPNVIEFGDLPVPRPGVMANPFLGLMVLCFVTIGLLFFDGYFGFSYLASIFIPHQPSLPKSRQKNTVANSANTTHVNTVMPNDLYDEAFWEMHQQCKLPMTSSNPSLDEPERTRRNLARGSGGIAIPSGQYDYLRTEHNHSNSNYPSNVKSRRKGRTK